jgi:hypothetical protein
MIRYARLRAASLIAFWNSLLSKYSFMKSVLRSAFSATMSSSGSSATCPNLALAHWWPLGKPCCLRQTARVIRVELRSSTGKIPSRRYELTCKPNSTTSWPSRTTAPGSPLTDSHRDQISQLTPGELDRYAAQLAHCLKALATTAPIRAHVQDELAAVRAEQDARATADAPAESRRQYNADGLTADELDRTRRELAASLALTRPGSPACAPIHAQLAAIDTELATRAARPARPAAALQRSGPDPGGTTTSTVSSAAHPRRADPHPGPVHADD